MTQAILFDFDGTLIDSQPAINGYFFSLLQQKGVKLTAADKKMLGGVSIKDSLAWLKKNKGYSMNYLEYLYHYWYFAIFHLGKIKAFPGVRDVLVTFRALGYKTAIVTNSPRKYTQYLIKKNQLQGCFDALVSVDDVGVPKPDPKMLRVAAGLLRVPYQQCIMIDDHEPGIVAGKTLGMRTIEITTDKNSKADMILPRIHDVIELIRE